MKLATRWADTVRIRKSSGTYETACRRATIKPERRAGRMSRGLADNDKISQGKERPCRASAPSDLSFFGQSEGRVVTKQEIAKTIMHCAALYEDNLCNRNYLILYSTASKNLIIPEHLETVFLSRHFKHLTGVKSMLKAEDFYKRCISSRLSARDFDIPTDGTCQLKMEVLPYLMNLHRSAKSTGVFSHGQGIYIRTERLVGSRRSGDGVCARHAKGRKYLLFSKHRT